MVWRTVNEFTGKRCLVKLNVLFWKDKGKLDENWWRNIDDFCYRDAEYIQVYSDYYEVVREENTRLSCTMWDGEWINCPNFVDTKKKLLITVNNRAESLTTSNSGWAWGSVQFLFLIFPTSFYYLRWHFSHSHHLDRGRAVE